MSLFDYVPKDMRQLGFAICAIFLLVMGFLGILKLFEIDAVICPDGSVLSGSCTRPPLPDGAVVIYHEGKTCPKGWSEFSEAKGRFIVGVGRHSQYGPYGDKLKEFKLLETGGNRTHKLEFNEMPEHKHTYIFSSGKNSPQKVDTTPSEFGLKDREKETTPSGRNLPHNNMPPYIALRFCVFVGR